MNKLKMKIAGMFIAKFKAKGKAKGSFSDNISKPSISPYGS